MLKIWGRANSSNVQKVLWTCEEISVPFDRIDAGGTSARPTAGLSQDESNGLVPTVEDGETVI
jgi:glutathione S-transferase